MSTEYTLLKVLTDLCRNGDNALPQNAICNTKVYWNLFHASKPKFAEEHDLTPYALNNYLKGTKPPLQYWYKSPEDTGHFFAGCAITVVLDYCFDGKNKDRVHSFLQTLKNYNDDKQLTETLKGYNNDQQLTEALKGYDNDQQLTEALDDMLEYSGRDIKKYSNKDMLKKLLDLPENPDWESKDKLFSNSALSKQGQMIFKFLKSVIAIVTQNEDRQRRAAESARPSNGVLCLRAILSLADTAGLPEQLLISYCPNIPFVKERLTELVDRRWAVRAEKSVPYDADVTVPYYTAALSPEKRKTLFQNLSKSKAEREYFRSFFTALNDKLLIREDIATLDIDEGEWYKNLLFWLPFCQKSTEKNLWPVDWLQELLGPIWQTFLKRAVGYFWYLNDAKSAQVLFDRCAPSTDPTEKLRESKQHTALLSAAGKDLSCSYMHIAELLEREHATLTAEQMSYAIDICCTYLFNNACKLNANLAEINANLKKIASYSPDFPVECCERHPLTAAQLEKWTCDPHQIVIQISRVNNTFILHALRLTASYSLRPITAPHRGRCCPNASPDCAHPQTTCDRCASTTGRVPCSICEYNPSCSILQAYQQMKHSFFLFKKNWAGELPSDMALKGLRLDAYQAFGIFYNEKLVSYVDVKHYPEQKMSHIGYMFTVQNFQGRKLSHALINHIRLTARHHSVYLTTYSRNSSMLRTCRNLGFHSTETIRDRICADILTDRQEIAPLLP